MAGLPRSARLCNAPRLGCALAAAIAGALTCFASHAGAQNAGQSGAQPAFDVASVKLHVPGSVGAPDGPGRFAGTFSVTVLISMAYGLQSGHQLVRPEWANTLFLDVNAKMPQGATKEQIPRMLQTLLAERLKLAVHQESRTMPVYELTVEKDGPKMKEADPSNLQNEILRFPQNRGFRGHLTMAQIAYLLADSLDRYVLDSTGLKGVYDVDVRWTPAEANTPAGSSEPLPVASEPSGLFRAVQEQLGLKLESRRGPVKVVVVDHVERVPTVN
jgi:uncharacterized protein (TIGR03435 family)